MDEHMLNDLLECSVCLERLDTSSKVLPCQHTFCRKCLEVIISSHQELRCPECRVLVDIKIDDLPPNVLLMRILEGMKNAAATKTQQQQQQQQNITMQLIETSRLKNINKQNDGKDQPQQHERLITNEQMQQQQQQYLQQKNSQQQQQSSLHQHNTQSSLVINQSSDTSNQPQQQQQLQSQQPQQQQRRCLLPHAYAMHDFESTEATDLRFKKGDLLLLKRKIDDNWYVGQANGSEGTFPINYVKVIVPLPIAQCIALYDFKMGPNEEEGCLSFRKGAIIHVLRRVDHNWAEGRLNNTIGIFPIAFVRLNAMAEQMLANKIQTMLQHQHEQLNNSEHLNSITLPTTTATINNNSTTTITLSSTLSPASTQPSATTTATNSCNSSQNNSNDNSINNSPLLSADNTPIVTNVTSFSDNNSIHDLQETVGNAQDAVQLRYREGREKRHSLNALLNSNSTDNVMATVVNTQRNFLQTNRHSAEILSVPHEIETTAEIQENMQNINIAMPQSTIAREQQQQQQQQQARCNVFKSPIIVQQQMIPPTLPWGYLALYPYKPRKNDELELKKGCVYIVTERCLDGWFKGKNWQDTLGVFPGNYVTPLRPRDQKQLMHQWKHVPLVSMAPMSNITTTTTTMATNTHRNNILPILQIPPPDAPPRQVASISPTSLPSPTTSSTTTCASVWTKPLGHTVEAFFNRHNNNNNNNNGNYNKNFDKNKESLSALSNSTVSGPASNSSITSTSTCTAVSLMKRLTSIKSRSKSPAAAATAKNLTINHQDEAKSNTKQQQQHIQTLHPMHVRSGSCPSRLLQNLPKPQLKQPTQQQPAASNEHILYTLQHNLQQQQQQRQQEHLATTAPTFTYGGSQRLKGCKERPSLQNARQSLDSNIIRNVYHNLHHQQQQAQQSQQVVLTTSTQPVQSINHRKSQSLDANTILRNNAATGLHNSTMSNNLSSLSTMSNSAANSKSTQNLRESRFRCIVPYPPNSEFELELHVGDIIYVHRKPKNGWFKGTCARTNKTGLFPASFVELDA